MSDRGGLGPHVHLSGQKSYLQIKEEMELQLGRPVSLGEVFIKVHTKPDGTFVDQKAQDVAKRFKDNMESKIMDIEADTSETSDGTSRTRDLTVDEQNEIFCRPLSQMRKEVSMELEALRRHM